MSRRALGLIAAVLVLAAAAGTTAASASKPVTPKLGPYYGQVTTPAGNGDVKVDETELKVVKTGAGMGAEVRISGFETESCIGDEPAFGLVILEKSPIAIKNGKFSLNRTIQQRGSGGYVTETRKIVLSGTFKSSTKVVVKASLKLSFSIEFPEQQPQKGTCTGKTTGIAKLKHH